MRLARILGFTGKLFIWTGAMLLLFVTYQLWGTGIAEARAQNSLEDDFEDRLAEFGLDLAKDLAAIQAPAPVGSTTTTEPLPTTTTLPAPPPDDGDAAARIVIPSIDVDKIVVEGVKRSDLRKGPGHYPQTPMPGQPGNAAIAGHRTTYGAPFNRIDELLPGDEIFVATLQGVFRYEVIGTEIVLPSAIEVVEDQGDNRLTLTSCHPEYSARQRIIVSAVLTDLPAPPPPTTTTTTTTTTVASGGGLAGDDDGDGVEDGAVSSTTTAPETVEELQSLDAGETREIDAALRWGAALFGVWLLGWLLSSRWRKWPGIAIAALPFIIVMLIFFDATTKALPANY